MLAELQDPSGKANLHGNEPSLLSSGNALLLLFLSSIHVYLHIQLVVFSLLFLSCTSVDLSKFNQMVNMGMERIVSELNGYRPVFLLCP